MSSRKRCLVDIVIPVFGQYDLLRQCLAALPEACNEPYDVILVDDCGPEPEKLQEMRNKEFPHARLFRNEKNAGFAHTVNTGVSKGKSPLILLLNSDVILQPKSIDNLIKELDDPGVGIAGPMLIFPEDSRWGNAGKVQHVGLCFDITGKPFHIFLGWDPDHPRVNVRRQVQMVTGACLLTRRKIYFDMGGMNPLYVKGTFEDVEYCLIAGAKGLKVVCQPSARGIHHTGASVTGAGIGFPINENYKIFKVRWGPTAKWDEYLHW